MKKKLLVHWIRPYRWIIVLAAIAGIVCAGVNVMVSDILKTIINMASEQRMDGILLVILEGGLILLAGMADNYATTYLTGFVGSHVVCDIRKQSMHHLSVTRPDYMERNGFGDTLSRLTQDVEGIRSFSENYLCDCLYVPIMVLVFSVYLCDLQPVLFLLTMGPLVLLVYLTTRLLTPVKLSQKKYSKMLGLANDNIKEACDGTSVIKAFALEDRIFERFERKLSNCLKLGQKNDWLQYRVIPLSSLIYELPVMIAMVAGGFMTFQQKMSIGSLVAYVSLLKILIGPLSEVYQLWVNSKSAMANLERIQAVFDEPSEDQPAEDQPAENQTSEVNYEKESDTYAQVRTLEPAKASIYEIRDLNFSYDGNEDVLHDVNLKIPVGSRTALVGMSGSGKSTLLRLLYRHYDSYTGDIFLNGKELRQYGSWELRDSIALISQSSFLFPISVADNIRIGLKGATDAQVIEAAKLANCHEFILELPNGYDTLVGENGSSLSGGQMQRLSIARAVLKNAEILLLDEPTSALDPESEALVSEAIDKLCECSDKTIISIAHRLSTIQDYDQIVLFEHGRIKERGTHTQLMRKEGRYAAFYQAFEA